MKKQCHAPRCIGKLEGERLFCSPKPNAERYRVWEEFLGKNTKKRKCILLCSKHFERKYLSIHCGEAVRLLNGARAIPTVHCQGPEKKKFYEIPCHAKHCTVKKPKGSSVTLHRFPRNPETCQEWVTYANNPRLLNRPLRTLYKSSYLCQHHFTDDQYYTLTPRRLIPGAIPTIPPPPDSSPIPSISCASSVSAAINTAILLYSSSELAVTSLSSHSHTEVGTQCTEGVSNEVTAGDRNSSTSDVIEKGLNEAVRSTLKVKIEDDSGDGFQTENSMETHESLPGVPQSSTQEIARDSELLTRVSQSNKIVKDAESCPNAPQSNTQRVLKHSELPQSNLKFIRQNDRDPCHIIEEFSEMYSLITLPYLEQANFNLQWVYKLLSREEGCERIVYEYPNKDDKNGFVLIRDSKWDGINLDKLHLLAIAYRPGIMTLRDLGMEHLGLLQNIYSSGKEIIMKKYGVVGSQLRMFIQYVPSFYHLHVHFTAMNDDICGSDFGTAHPLHLVIHNIQMFPTYYQTVPLTLCLKESDELFQEFEAQGVVARIQPSS